MLASSNGKRAIENFTDGLKSCETESEENLSEWAGNESGCEKCRREAITHSMDPLRHSCRAI